MTPLHMQWPKERADELQRLWNAGYSASAIAVRFGVTKNAVIGKVTRMRQAATRPINRAPTPKATDWKPEEIEILGAHVTSQSDVISAALMDAGFNRTRVAINHAMRKHFPSVVASRMRMSRASNSLANKARIGALRRPAYVAPEPVEPWTGPSINILDDNLKHFQCRHIVEGSGVNTMFCGAPIDEDSTFSFCRFHMQGKLSRSTGRKWTPEQRQKMLKHFARAAEAV